MSKRVFRVIDDEFIECEAGNRDLTEFGFTKPGKKKHQTEE